MIFCRIRVGHKSFLCPLGLVYAVITVMVSLLVSSTLWELPEGTDCSQSPLAHGGHSMDRPEEPTGPGKFHSLPGAREPSTEQRTCSNPGTSQDEQHRVKATPLKRKMSSYLVPGRTVLFLALTPFQSPLWPQGLSQTQAVAHSTYAEKGSKCLTITARTLEAL